MDHITSAWKVLQNAPVNTKRQAFLNYCEACVDAKESGNLVEEETAYKICGCIFMDELTDQEDLEAVIHHACTMEIPRETSAGSGISMDEKWTKKAADAFKEREYQKLLELIKKAKSDS